MEGTETWVSSMSAYRAAKEEQERQSARQREARAAAGQHGSSSGTSEALYEPPHTVMPMYIEQPGRIPSQQITYMQRSQPTKQELSRRHASFLLYFIVAAHAALFVVAVSLASWDLAELADNPLLGPGVDALLKIGATASYKMANNYQYWRLLVSPFLGAGVLHVWANVSAIFTYGMFLSNDLSVWQIGVLYLTTGLSAVTTSANIGSNYITAAGSGPAFGFIGGACVVLLLHFRRLRNHILSWLLIALSLAINSFIGSTPFVDNSGNSAAFVAGLLMVGGMLCTQWTPATHRAEVATKVLAAALLSAAVLLPVIGIIGLNGSLPLGGCCDVWVCAPSSWWNCNASQVLPNSCTFSAITDGTTTVGCPQGQSYQVPGALVNYGNTTADTLNAVCQAYCTASGYPPGSGQNPGGGDSSSGTASNPGSGSFQ